MDGSHYIVQKVCAVLECYNPSVILQVQRDYVISNEDCDRRNCMRQELKQHDDFRSLVRVTVRSTMNRNYHIETVTQMPKCWLGISTPLPLSSDLRRPPSPLQRWQPDTHTRKCLACAVGSVGLGVAFEASQLIPARRQNLNPSILLSRRQLSDRRKNTWRARLWAMFTGMRWAMLGSMWPS